MVMIRTILITIFISCFVTLAGCKSTPEEELITKEQLKKARIVETSGTQK